MGFSSRFSNVHESHSKFKFDLCPSALIYVPAAGIFVPLDFDFCPRTLNAVASTRDNQGEPTPFQRFDSLMRSVISVPKAEIDKRQAEYKRQREEARRAKKR